MNLEVLSTALYENLYNQLVVQDRNLYMLIESERNGLAQVPAYVISAMKDNIIGLIANLENVVNQFGDSKWVEERKTTLETYKNNVEKYMEEHNSLFNDRTK